MVGKKATPFPAQDARARKLSATYREMYEKLQRHLLNQEENHVRCTILLDHILIDFEEAQANDRDINTLVGKNFRSYLTKLEKSIDFNVAQTDQKRIDFEKFTISGIWFTICAYLVLLFVKEFLTDRFLINFYIDMLVGVIAFYLALNNLINHKRILQRQNLSLKSFQLEIMGLLVAGFIVIISLQSPFDISFLILVVTHLSAKRLAKAEFNR